MAHLTQKIKQRGRNGTRGEWPGYGTRLPGLISATSCPATFRYSVSSAENLTGCRKAQVGFDPMRRRGCGREGDFIDLRAAASSDIIEKSILPKPWEGLSPCVPNG